MSPSPSRRVSRLLSGTLILAVLAWFIILPVWMNHASAAPLSEIRDVLSDSAPSMPSDHTVTFTTPSGIAEGQTITVTFPAEFSLTGLSEDDVDIAENSVDLTTAPNCSGSEEARVAVSGQVVTVEVCAGNGGAIAPASSVVIEIGAHATSSGTGAQQIDNPASANDYEISIGGSMADSGDTRVSIHDAVVVSSEVDTTLTFAVGGVSDGVNINGEGVATFASTTATTVPFGLLTPASPKTLGQDLFVTTNAVNGFVVTVQASSELASENGADINTFVDGSATSVPALWQLPSGDPYDNMTWGHWGVTTEDDSLEDGDSFGVARYAGNFVSVPRPVMYHGSIADGATAHIGATRVGYKVEITGMQEAASDYRTTLTYVCTPSF